MKVIKATADPLIIIGLWMQYYQVMQCRVSLVIFCKANKMSLTHPTVIRLKVALQQNDLLW